MKAAPQECWHIWIDTGGTFTDCVAIAPDATTRRAKVLSSGRLRFAIDRIINDRTLALRAPWPSVPQLMTGWQAFVHPENDGANVTSFDCDAGVITLEHPFAHSPSAGDLLEIRSTEDAPVLAARIVTGTPPGKAFPPIRMRLATTRGTNALLERRGHPRFYSSRQDSATCSRSAPRRGPTSSHGTSSSHARFTPAPSRWKNA
jgi:5-oxoprolinase (ATP-hydrolysing)